MMQLNVRFLDCDHLSSVCAGPACRARCRAFALPCVVIISALCEDLQMRTPDEALSAGGAAFVPTWPAHPSVAPSRPLPPYPAPLLTLSHSPPLSPSSLTLSHPSRLPYPATSRRRGHQTRRYQLETPRDAQTKAVIMG